MREVLSHRGRQLNLVVLKQIQRAYFAQEVDCSEIKSFLGFLENTDGNI